MKIISIVGARPQFIKLGPLSKKIRHQFDEVIIHTGQHFDPDMSELFFEQLCIPKPKYNLGINSGEHGNQTGRMLIELEKVVMEEKPDAVIVFGDTNTTLAGALVASKLHITTFHIEAGLRSFNRTMPEEINRILADHTCDFLFAPTHTAVRNLKQEGLVDRATKTGDIMVDALFENLPKAKKEPTILKSLHIEPENYHVLTLHRPYNVDNPKKLSRLLMALNDLVFPVIFPVHPRTRKIIYRNNLAVLQNIKPIAPIGYLDFITLMSNSRKIITDSGGIQKEAYILKKPCITLRAETEWIETVHDGWNILINDNYNNLKKIIHKFNPTSPQTDIFGKNVAARMVDEIKAKLK